VKLCCKLKLGRLRKRWENKIFRKLLLRLGGGWKFLRLLSGVSFGTSGIEHSGSAATLAYLSSSFIC
jgi:hypothetical protein